MSRSVAALCAVLIVGGCGSPAPAPDTKNEFLKAHAEGTIELTADQIAAAGISLIQPVSSRNGAAIEAPALLESDPEATRIVATPLGGRIVKLTRNLGDAVARGETLALLESREAAILQADVERARTRLKLARSVQDRDEKLYARGFRPLREVEITRAAAEEADVSLRLARQQLSASGARGGSLNRIVITSPIAGRVVSRSVILGQTYATEATGAELFRIANLDRLSVALSLSPDDAARVRPGAMLEVTAGQRHQQARIGFVSPILDPGTRLVRVIADLDNRSGEWRAGEPVQARIRVAGVEGRALMIPAVAVQTVENRQIVFARTRTGFRTVPIVLGRREGAMVAVTRGLSGGERIAAANSFTLKAELGKGEAEHGEH
ncbi:MAG: efflux transporter periplasmic adaptor subunit [Rhizorhabdus sp.]|nr:efflux transporter periplasmic adaptor subunit [Rhizorhabdus sp.]